MKSKTLKKILSAVLAGAAVLCFTACGSEKEETNSDSTAAAQTEEENDTAATTADDAGGDAGKSIVVYFSWSGNTEAVAKEIQSQTGADLFEIVPAEPYTDDYDELLDIAQEEQSNDARPEIADTVDLSGYDTVYLGYPNWWGDMPMIMYTFLDEYDLSGKTVAPFNTSGGSGFSGTLDTIAEMEPEAEITEGLTLGSSEASDCSDAVSEWLESL